MLRLLRTYRSLHAALALALLLSAALPVVRHVCEMMGEAADVSVLAAVEHGEGAAAMPVCERHGADERECDHCPEQACTVRGETQSPALTSSAPRLPEPDRLFMAALFAVQEQASVEEAHLLVATRDVEKTLPEHVPVRLRTSTYLL